MKICFFGTYKEKYNRNTSIKEGLESVGVKVSEVHIEISDERMELPEDFTISKTFHRVFRKIGAFIKLMTKSSDVVKSDYIFVLHPGHLDLPWAKLLSIVSGKKLIFDSSISPYDTMFVGRNIANKNSFKARLVKKMEKFLLSMPDKIFVDTNLMKNFIVKEMRVKKDKVFVVPLGANNKLYKPSKFKNSPKKIKVLFFGLFSPLHGVFNILQAAKLLKNQKEIEITILGDGYLKQDLINFADKNKLGNVVFKSFIPEAELVKQIQQSNIVLGVFSTNPVFQRSIPNKVFAAIACKKALITADLPPMKEKFTNLENVLFCKPEDPKSLAKAIRKLSEDKNLSQRLSENGYKLYLENFTPKKIGETIINSI